MTFTTQQKKLSSLIGGALGDALGYSREFSPVGQHLKNIPGRDWRNADFDNAPNAAHYQDETGHALVSDDTQMTIATGRALLAAENGFRIQYTNNLAAELARKYVAWSKHPDNTRAPGGACMSACRKLDDDRSWETELGTWIRATDIDTMGCGANMRVAPIGLYMNPGAGSLIDIAYLSSAMTHAHPAALASAALTTAAVTGAFDGMNGREILDMLLDMCEMSQFIHYPETVLGPLWELSQFDSALSYLQAGYQRCGFYLRQADRALRNGWKGQNDPCIITGEGWTAPEALAGAMLCTVGLWDEPVQVLQRAAVSKGDSDSLASIAGNIRGAAGVEWPEHLVSRLEQGPVRELHALAKAL